MKTIGRTLYYESKDEAARGYGVARSTIKYYLQRGILKGTHVGGSAVLIKVGQHGEDKHPGWPNVPRTPYSGPRIGKDAIVGRKPYPANRKPRASA